MLRMLCLRDIWEIFILYTYKCFFMGDTLRSPWVPLFFCFSKHYIYLLPCYAFTVFLFSASQYVIGNQEAKTSILDMHKCFFFFLQCFFMFWKANSDDNGKTDWLSNLCSLCSYLARFLMKLCDFSLFFILEIWAVYILFMITKGK